MTTRKTTTPRRSAAPAVRKPAASSARRPGAVRRRKATPDSIPAVDVVQAATIDTAEVDNPAVDVAGASRFEASAEEQIRVRAYFLHLARQGRPANPVEDWLNAEREWVGSTGV